jgi:hypothetical protein
MIIITHYLFPFKACLRVRVYQPGALPAATNRCMHDAYLGVINFVENIVRYLNLFYRRHIVNL